MKTNEIRTYAKENTCAHGITGYYYTEPLFPNGEAEFYRWV